MEEFWNFECVLLDAYSVLRWISLLYHAEITVEEIRRPCTDAELGLLRLAIRIKDLESDGRHRQRQLRLRYHA